MLIFKDVLTGEALSSDEISFELVDNLIYEFKGSYVSGGVEGTINDIDFLRKYQLVEVILAKSEFKGYIQRYSKKVLVYLQCAGGRGQDIDNFKKGMSEWVARIMDEDRWNTLQFYRTKGDLQENPEGQLCIVEWRDGEGGAVPYLLLIKEGVKLDIA